MRSHLTTLALCLLPACMGPGAASNERSDAPNVLLILADDLGYQDLGCYGHPSIRTPVLDGLAARGVRLTDFHSGATVCTPSRMALLTGAYPSRVGWTTGVIGFGMSREEGMHTDAVTLGQLFQDAGYRTALVGKWHLGNTPARRPHRRGFDESFHIPVSNNQGDAIWRGDEIVEQPFENRRLTESFAREAERFLCADDGRPFFLYLPLSAPHFPVEAHPEWEGRSAFGAYGDVVEELDAAVGGLLDALDAQGQLENTLVLFCSDNGPQPGEAAAAAPFRGEKWSALEGGTRVPMIASWPGVLPEGEVRHGLVSAMDLMPTLARVCGLDLEEVPQTIDGVDVWDHLRVGSDSPRADLLLWHGQDPVPQAIRVGDWKYFPRAEHALKGLGQRRRTPAQARLLQATDPGGPLLFHLPDDPGEVRDLAQLNREQLEKMRRRYEHAWAALAPGD